MEITERAILENMVRYTKTQDVKSPRERVFRYLTEVERFPAMFPDIFRKMEVVGKEDSARVILCEEQWAGRHLKYKMREHQEPPHRIERMVIEGNGKGTTETLRLEELSDGTRLTMDIEAKGLAATILGRLFRKQFEAEMNHIFEGYTRVIEASA